MNMKTIVMVSETQHDNSSNQNIFTQFTDIYNTYSYENLPPINAPAPQTSDKTSIKPKPKRKKFTLGSHIEIIHGTPPQFRCKICKCRFKQKHQGIKYHAYCATGKKPLSCELCGQEFVTKSHLNYHIRTHTGETPFKCSYCGKGFKQKDKVKRHERIHTGENKLTCEICNKVLRTSFAFKAHQVSHTTEKPFKCKECGKSYALKANLNRHYLSHTGIKEYVCETCGKGFVRKHSLIIHINSHSGRRVFSCDKCPQTFKSRKCFIRHKHIHADKCNFECTLCGVKFRRKDNMDRHLKNTHPEGNGNRKNTKDPSGNPEEERVVQEIINRILGEERGDVNTLPKQRTQSVITHTKFCDKTQADSKKSVIRESVIKMVHSNH